MNAECRTCERKSPRRCETLKTTFDKMSTSREFAAAKMMQSHRPPLLTKFELMECISRAVSHRPFRQVVILLSSFRRTMP